MCVFHEEAQLDPLVSFWVQASESVLKRVLYLGASSSLCCTGLCSVAVPLLDGDFLNGETSSNPLPCPDRISVCRQNTRKLVVEGTWLAFVRGKAEIHLVSGW